MSVRRDTFGFLLVDVSRLLRRAFRQGLADSSLTYAQARVLVHVSRYEGVRQVELAELLEVQPITLARLLDQLTQAELVERRADPADRRAYQIFLRPAATEHLAAIYAVCDCVQAEALRGLDAGQVETVSVALRQIRDNLSSR